MSQSYSAEELRQPSPLTEEILLPTDLAASIYDATLSLPKGIYSESFEARGDFLKACDPLVGLLRSSSIHPALHRLKEGQTVLLTLHGLPVDKNLPPAPLDGQSPEGKDTFVSEGIACAIAENIGVPSILLGEKHEALVHQITPVPGQEKSQSNEGSVRLKMHQDLAPNPEMPGIRYSQFMPDWLILTGLQTGSETTKTFVASVDEAVAQLSPQMLEVLKSKRFITDPPESFLKNLDEASKLVRPAHSVLSEVNGALESDFDTSSNVRPRDPEDEEAAEVLKAYSEALDSVKQEVVIEPGTAVIFNNRRVVHGRSGVAHETDPAKKRWIQRVYVFDIDRMARESIDKSLILQLGGGVIRVTSVAMNSRLVEMAMANA